MGFYGVIRGCIGYPGFYRGIWGFMGFYRVIWGLYRDSGKENGIYF